MLAQASSHQGGPPSESLSDGVGFRSGRRFQPSDRYTRIFQLRMNMLSMPFRRFCALLLDAEKDALQLFIVAVAGKRLEL